ncbi:hypothetical protein J6590_023592 [Homalodisca vitripennis]|nr:hypothetical protein J6590_023592 [Homalodisca vitripennis]
MKCYNSRAKSSISNEPQPHALFPARSNTKLLHVNMGRGDNRRKKPYNDVNGPLKVKYLAGLFCVPNLLTAAFSAQGDRPVIFSQLDTRRCCAVSHLPRNGRGSDVTAPEANTNSQQSQEKVKEPPAVASNHQAAHCSAREGEREEKRGRDGWKEGSKEGGRERERPTEKL